MNSLLERGGKLFDHRHRTNNTLLHLRCPRRITGNYPCTIRQNLTSDAIKALTNQPNASIHWQARLEEGQGILIIHAYGPGISEDRLT